VLPAKQAGYIKRAKGGTFHLPPLAQLNVPYNPRSAHTLSIQLFLLLEKLPGKPVPVSRFFHLPIPYYTAFGTGFQQEIFLLYNFFTINHINTAGREHL